MTLNLTSTLTPSDLYSQGWLPQRNQKGLWYQDTSSRANLNNFRLSSENRRILNSTSDWNFLYFPLNQFVLSPSIKKQIIGWVKTLGWEFPPSSIKNIFKNHIFNHIYTWSLEDTPPLAYALCYSDPEISHIAYVFYDPNLAKSNLPIRMVLQAVIDSQKSGHRFCYLGGFNPTTKYGYYKRNMPGFEYFLNNSWQPLNP
ncbi:MAG: hypothetical protein WCT01_03630 [Candidatus Shapirobacteria bacterium]